MKFTTSWDDGFALDMRVADILDAHGMKGTFYVSPKIQDEQKMLTPEEIRNLSYRHEIGAHTISHQKLTTVTVDQAQSEITESKKWVEEITGKPCEMFCYPCGDVSRSVCDLVKEAGFKGARTTEKFKFSGDEPFLLPTSVVLNPFPFRRIANRRFIQPLQLAWPHLRKLNIPITSCRGWLPMAKAVFLYAYKTSQPWFHLWGHSNDIERYKQWNVLEAFLDYINQYNDIEYVINSELL